jgi:predicted nucleic acid-binding protein
MKTIYIESSILSYLTARTTNNLRAAAWQEITNQWWDTKKQYFELVTSPLVITEISRGNKEAAQKRLNAIQDISQLKIDDKIIDLAVLLLKKGALPEKATDDAMHVAFAVYHGIDYLLTWNCRHIDNAEKKPLIRSICIENGYAYPEICTPLELMGDEND